MNTSPSRNVHYWLIEPLAGDVAQSINSLSAADDVQHVAVMPDVHLARDVCIGAVIATSRLIYPAAVGSDIGCGMAAIRFDADADLLIDETRAAQVLGSLYRSVPSNRHRTAAIRNVLPDVLNDQTLSNARLDKLKHRDGRVQLGTLGRGNHFLEFQADGENRLWLMVHSGSRAMGQAIMSHHLDKCVSSAATGLRYLTADSDSGGAYLRDVRWALRYAELNRLAMISAVTRLMADLFGIVPENSSLIHGSHNHVCQETHFGRQFWIHRKGAQRAVRGQMGIIPGSMGTAQFPCCWSGPKGITPVEFARSRTTTQPFGCETQNWQAPFLSSDGGRLVRLSTGQSTTRRGPKGLQRHLRGDACSVRLDAYCP